MLLPSSTMITEFAFLLETFVSSCKITLCQNPGDYALFVFFIFLSALHFEGTKYFK
jgi:hypothetical protein